MIVSRDRCLQAVGNECEFVGHDHEQNVDLVCNESELKNAMFASRDDYVCKLLHIATWSLGHAHWSMRHSHTRATSANW